MVRFPDFSAILFILVIGFFGFGVCAQSFVNVTAVSGINVPPASAWGGHGRGSAWADFDGDGDMDLFSPGGPGHPIEVWWNAGGVFSSQLVLPYTIDRHDHGCIAVDFDNDGDQDVYLCQGNFKPNKLFVNDGLGNFTDMAGQCGVAGLGDSYACSFGDYDRDGWLDLYVGNLDPQPGQALLSSHVLYHNNGDGTFTDVTTSSGTTSPSAALAVVFHDHDGDGWMDIHCCNDRGNFAAPPNSLLRNNRDGTFTDIAPQVNADAPIGCMGATMGDVHNDGDWDVFLTNVQAGHVFLEWDAASQQYLHLGDWFQNAAIHGLQTSQIGWGCQFFDYNCDGLLDLFVMHELGTNRLFRGTPQNFFVDDTYLRGIDVVLPPELSCAVVDYDDDGAIDIWVPGDSTAGQLVRNPGPIGNWLRIRTQGTQSNRDGIGAVVIATSASGSQRRMVTTGEGYLSGSDRRVHFGVGTDTVVGQLEIRWPSGTVQFLDNLAVNQEITVVEPEYTVFGTLASGSTAVIRATIPQDVGLPYFAGLTLGISPEVPLIDGRSVRANPTDPLLLWTTTPGNPILASFAGNVGPSGNINTFVSLPAGLPLSGARFWSIAVTVNGAYPSGIKTIIGPQLHIVQ